MVLGVTTRMGGTHDERDIGNLHAVLERALALPCVRTVARMSSGEVTRPQGNPSWSATLPVEGICEACRAAQRGSTVTPMLALLPILLFSTAFPTQDPKPTADGLVQQAWQLLPTYAGAHRASLSPDLARDVQAGIHLLEAATTLEPEHLRGLWSLGHAHVLVGEDAKSRGRARQALLHYEGVETALGTALALAPSDPWAAYARGASRTAFGHHGEALADLDLAVANADALLNDVGEPLDIAWLRFKSLEWRCEVLMRLHRFDEAREALTAYHDAFSNNAWPLQIALAESHEREWDLAAARADYEQAVTLFPDDYQAHAMLGYVEGLLGNGELAAEHLQRAIGFELGPGLYTRLWWMILSEGEARSAALTELRDLLENPPSSFAAWDLLLGHFLLGESYPEEFIAAGQTELQRRLDASENTDDLMCEVYFYAGLWQEIGYGDARGGPGLYYQLALLEHPLRWKWEWAYSRLFLARYIEAGGAAPASSIEIDGDQYRSSSLEGTLTDVHWSVPLAERTVRDLGREPRPGDVLIAVVLDGNAQPHSITRVFGAE